MTVLPLTPCVISSLLPLPYMTVIGFQGLFTRLGTSEGKQLGTAILPAFSIAMVAEFIIFSAQHSERDTDCGKCVWRPS